MAMKVAALMRLRTRAVPMLLILLLTAWPGFCDDKSALLAFKKSVDRYNRLPSWKPKARVCSWTGVGCSDSGRVTQLRLSSIDLEGEIPEGTLSQLDQLWVLALVHNNLTGPFPEDFKKLTELRMLVIPQNRFSGPLSDMGVWPNLVHLHLAHNFFDGNIPSSLSALTNLKSLDLGFNKFVGELNGLNPPNLQNLSLAFNMLNGSIPTELQKFGYTAFVGNDLCGPPMDKPCNVNNTAGKGNGHSGNKTPWYKSDVFKYSLLVGLFLIICVLLCLWSFWMVRNDNARKPEVEVIYFDGGLEFNPQKMLHRSAQILGYGPAGKSIKTVAENGESVVVKLLELIYYPDQEFATYMMALGKLRHPNLLALRAYFCFSSQNKMLFYDYMPLGSVASLIHGKEPMNWQSRLHIALGAASGIAHLHEQGYVHGDIKANNILLKHTPTSVEALVSDYGLAPLFVNSKVDALLGGYRAPEISRAAQGTHMSDVYSFGVFLLELLTGKEPMDLPQLLQAVGREEWSSQVFSKDLAEFPDAATDNQMMELLQLALRCISTPTDQRPTIREVVKTIEHLEILSKQKHIKFAEEQAVFSGSCSALTVRLPARDLSSWSEKGAHQSDKGKSGNLSSNSIGFQIV